MYLPSADGIVGNRATVRLTTAITTAAITSDQTHNLRTRRRFGCFGVPAQAGGAPSSAMERQVRSLLSPAAIIGATVSPTIPAGLLPGCWVINSTAATASGTAAGSAAFAADLGDANAATTPSPVWLNKNPSCTSIAERNTSSCATKAARTASA